jgi:acyl-CoA thioesterase-1
MMRAACAAGLLALAMAAAPARGAEAPCPVPENLALGDISLPAARAAMARDGKLVVMTLGGAATAGGVVGDARATYPAQLQGLLSSLLPGIRVEVVNCGTPGHGTAYAVRDLAAWLAQARPGLVIWGTGAREMARGVDPDAFAASLQAGIDAIHQIGADVILLDLQYAPSIARLGDAGPYRAVLEGTAAANDLAFLPRYELMMSWNDDGILDLDAQTPAARRIVARRLFACLAGALAPAIARALR